MTQNYDTDFGQFEGATKSLMSQLNPIVSAGPDQYGYDPAEDASLRSTAISSDAAAASSAEAAANEQITASNGGAALTPTGAQEELKQQTDVNAAQKEASDLQSVTQSGYKQGTQNYDTALSAEENTLGLMNPNTFASSATSGGGAATGAVNAATNAAEASDSWMGMVGGALGGVAGALTK